MRKASYPAVFEPSGKGFGVYFPDLPGCVSYGDSFEDAERQAEDALGLHLYGMEKDGEVIPPASEKPLLDPDTAPGSFLVVISVYPDLVAGELDNRRVKTNVTLPAWLKEVAEAEDINYSKLLEVAVIDYLRTKNVAPRKS